MPARTLGLVLSLWLFFSAFAWPRTHASFANAWIVGLLAAAASLASMRVGPARFMATVLSAWLVVSAVVIGHRTPMSFWNDLGVGVLMLLLSLVPGTMYLPEHRARA
jgi:hypothetical protein